MITDGDSFETANSDPFERRYWRSAPQLPKRLNALEARAIADDQFRLLADNIPTLCWIANGDGYIVWYNRRWHQYCGTTPEQMEGWGWQSAHDPDLLPEVMERWTSAIATGQPFEMTFPLRGADGRFRPFLTRIQPLRDESGEVVRWFGVNTDISSTVGAEQALRLSEESLRLVLDSAMDYAILTTDPERRVTSWSAGAARAFGYSAKEMIGTPADILFTPEDRASGRPELEVLAARESGCATDERWHVRADGRPVFMNGSVHPLPRDSDGRERGFIKIARDETDRLRREEALRDSELRYRSLLAASSQVLYRHNADWSEMLELTGAGFLADTRQPDRDWFDKYIHPDDQPEVLGTIREAIRTKSRFELEHRVIREDGSLGWTLSRSIPILDDRGEILEWFGAASDVSARHEAEAALREETRTLETLNRIGAAVAAELDIESVVQLVTDAGVELTGANFGAFFYNVVADEGESYMLYALSGVERSAFERFPMPRKTAIFGPTFDGSAIVRSDDITSDPRYGKNSPYHGMPEGHLPVTSYLAVPVISRSGEVLGGLFFGHSDAGRFNERHERLILGIAAQAAIAIDNGRLFQSLQREVADRSRAENELRDLNDTLEQRVLEEIKRRSQAEEALRQSQKMETVGQLTGGIAHDFNNLLQIVTGNLDTLLRNLPAESGRMRRAAENAMTGANRAATLTQRLLAFSRRQPLVPTSINVNRLVSNMSELLHRTLGEKVEIETVLASRLWSVEADANQLENALLNLAVNGRDAMPNGGKLTIETQNTYLDRDYVALNPEMPHGQYVVVCISDTGTGMDSRTVSRAFEPFFTTKQVGQGTGLGLSMVYGFVKQSGGHVKIYSEPGEGTTVKIYLPRFKGKIQEQDEPEARLVPEGTRDETILVCEDDDDVRAYSVDCLRELGYRVLEAHDGTSALRLLARQEEPVHLLFTDVVLPGALNGAQLAAEARTLSPDLKVLFTTGYARNAIVHHGRLDEGVQLLTKPFSFSDLAARVRDILDART